jgi:hypothetical protein
MRRAREADCGRWRREWDSNPRGGISAYTISNRAPSTARTSLRVGLGTRCAGWPTRRASLPANKSPRQASAPPYDLGESPRTVWRVRGDRPNLARTPAQERTPCNAILPVCSLGIAFALVCKHGNRAKKGNVVKLIIAVALLLGTLIGFEMAVAFNAPRPTRRTPHSIVEIRCVPWSPDSAAIAKKHRFRKAPTA